MPNPQDQNTTDADTDTDMIICTDCETAHPDREARSINDDRTVCESCAENYRTCESCSTQGLAEYMNTSPDGYWYCSSCFGNAFQSCNECGDVYNRDDIDNDGYCSDCAEDNSEICSNDERINAPFLVIENGALDSTHRTEKSFKDTLFLGVELEVENTNHSRNDDACSVKKMFPSVYHEPTILCKEDGSLNNGFEIVSCPATLDAHRLLWRDFFRDRPKNTSLKSHDTKTCGLHVHVSRAPLSDMQIAKLVLFVNARANTHFIEAIARRPANRYCQIKPKRVPDIFNADDGILSNPDRYEAINLQNDATIEFRLFRGTLKEPTFFRTLEFVEALVMYCAPAEVSLTRALHWNKFADWVIADKDRKVRYANLVKWLEDYKNNLSPE